MRRGSTVVIGGGAIGLSVAWHLGQRGAEDVILLERNRLTSGTSWHAAGIVGPLRSSYNLTVLARYGVELFARLETETGQATGYRQTGGMWLAQSRQRMIELRRMQAIGDMHGLHARVLTPEGAQERFPLLDTGGLAGALWVDEDGQVNPVDLCMAYARGARRAGVTTREHCGVARMEKHGDHITTLVLDSGEEIPVLRVINCAGLWAGQVAAMAGASAPVLAVEHMYVVSDPMPGLPDPCPIVRDLDSGIYLKGDAGRLLLGQFEANARVWQPSSMDPSADFLEFPEDWDHVEPMLRAGIARVPSLGERGITRFLNGPESFTPDTRQLMGRVPGFDNFFIAAGFNSIGVMSSAGVGRVMADWMLDGESPMDLWDVDIRRMLPGDADADFLSARIPEAVHHQFSIHWPYKQHQSGRDRMRSPWHERMAAAGAVFGAPTGWERPLWFAGEESERGMRYSHEAQCWWAAAERESKGLMHAGALFDLSPFTKIDIEGTGAGAALQHLCTNAIDVAPGRVVYTLMLNERGGIEAEATVTRIDANRWRLVTGAATRVRDLERLRRLLPGSVRISDRTEEEAVLGVMGPASQALLVDVLDDASVFDGFEFSTARSASIGGDRVYLARISYAGEFGYELYCPVGHADTVLKAIIAVMPDHDVVFAGHFCLDACRLEKGYVHWGHDIGPDDDPVSAGLLFAVRLTAGFDFIGREAVAALVRDPPLKRRALFAVNADRPLLLHDEPIYCNGERVGRSTSGGLGFRTGHALTMGYVEGGDDPSSRWEIDVAGERYEMTPLALPPYDPTGRRMKA